MEKERTWERERDGEIVESSSLVYFSKTFSENCMPYTTQMWIHYGKKKNCIREKVIAEKSFNLSITTLCVCVIYMKWANEPHYSTSWSFMNFSSNHDCFCWCPFRLGLRVYRESGVCRLISQHHIRHQSFWLLFSFFFSRNNFLIWLNMILCVYLCLFS